MPEDTHPSTHPPLPPTTEDDRLSWLRLLRSRRVGNATFFRLMGEYGSASAALAAAEAATADATITVSAVVSVVVFVAILDILLGRGNIA